MSESSKTKGVVNFILLAFGIAWVLWEVPLRLGVSIHSALFQLVALPGGFAPAISAFVVRRWVTKEGFADAGLRPNLSKWRCYLVGWLLPFPATAVILLLSSVLRVGEPDFSLRRALEILSPQSTVPSLSSYIWLAVPFQLAITALITTPILWGEEFGWRGYLQIRLLSRRPLLAAVATGLIWGAWHYPLNVRGYSFPGHPVLGQFVFAVTTVLISIIFGWLRQCTGSVWSTSLAHAATNAIGGSLTTLLYLGGADMLYVGYGGLLAWVPLGALCAWIVFTGRLGHTGQPVGTTVN